MYGGDELKHIRVTAAIRWNASNIASCRFALRAKRYLFLTPTAKNPEVSLEQNLEQKCPTGSAWIPWIYEMFWITTIQVEWKDSDIIAHARVKR